MHDSGCVCPEHNVEIEIYYNEIVHASKIYVDLHVPAEPRSALKHYWSVQLDYLKEQSKIFYDLWLFAGKPRSGDIYYFMKSFNYKYKSAIRHAIKSFENQFSYDFVQEFICTDYCSFWKTW